MREEKNKTATTGVVVGRELEDRGWRGVLFINLQVFTVVFAIVHVPLSV